MNIYETRLLGIDENGNEKEFSVTNFKGKNIILYFYPSDGTSGCTQEARDFRDSMDKINKYAQVVGVSPSDIESHKKFMSDHDLNFILLSDPEHKLADFFGTWGEKEYLGKKIMDIIRSTFLINSEGEIVKAWKNVQVEGHVDEVIDALKLL